MTLTRVAVPRRAAGVQLLGAMAGSGYREAPALVRRADGQTITLTPLLHLTLQAVDGVRDYDEIAEVVTGQIPKSATGEDIEYLVEHKLRPLGLVCTGDDPEPTTRKVNPLLALRLKVVVSDPALTRRLTAPFGWLFRPWVALPLLVGFMLASWWILVDKGLASATHQAFYEPGMLLVVWALVIASAGFHEIGHAAACRYGGATPGVMGAGLYLVWPAFYTEVTDSYRLGRGGRLRVDLGGLYFNAIFAMATMAAWLVLRSDALLLVVAAQHLQMVRQLAPFIRADGYHIVADLTGVPDLFAHIKPTLLALVPKRWGGRRHATLKPWARFVVSAWVLLVVPLLLTLFAGAVHLLPRLAATAWDSMGVQWHAATVYWADGAVAATIVRLLSIVLVALPVAGIVYLLARIARRTGVRVWTMTSGRPNARAVTVLVAAVAAGVVAWSWWPSDQYQPIQGDEGGRITQLVDTVGGPHPSGPPSYSLARTPVTTSGLAAPPPALPRPAAQPVTATDPVAPTFYLIRPTTTAAATTTATATTTAPPVVDQPDAIAVAELPGEGTWVFPFPAPAPREDGDNRATAVNTDDGELYTALSVALAIVTGEEDVDQRNEAFAYASCTDCTTTAVAFQALLILGQADVITPVNTAVAANYECVRCHTAAIASQLVVSLTSMPSDEALQKVRAALDRLRGIEDDLDTLSVEQVYQVLTATKAEILQILEEDGTIPTVLTDTAARAETSGPVADPSSSTSPAASASASSAPDAGIAADSDDPSSEPSTEPSTEPSSSPSPEPTTSDSPSPTPSPSPSPTSSPSASPSPSPTATSSP
ncbi:MAG TPA: hypothetical protein VFG63_03160 [Nocardioidaceae bacterium]|nr:hypothetical protein [Nocardioidaceae bacterium]